MNIILKTLIGVVYGIVLGFATIVVSKNLTLKRTEDPAKAAPLDTILFKIAAPLIGIVLSVAVVLTAEDVPLMIRNLILLLPLASISVVDGLVRKIPNPLLLVMIIVQAVYLTYYCISNKTTNPLIMAGFGFFIGFAACTVPSILRIPVGSGDIKYSAVIGLCIYLTGYLQSMVIMGITALICLAYLKATKKGGMKSMVPMGPLISIGTVITMCFPFLEQFIGKVYTF